MLTTREWSYLKVLEIVQSLLPEIGQYKSRQGNKGSSKLDYFFSE